VLPPAVSRQPLRHYFFSSRVELPTKLLVELENNIAKWTQGITFEPADPNVYPAGKETVENGKVITETDPCVPVLDPITIAMHLHAYYIKASNDLIKYLTPIDDPDDPESDMKKEKAKKRQKKFTLALLVDSLLDANGALVAHAEQDAIYDFRHDYSEQVRHLKQWRSRWATYLTNIADLYLFRGERGTVYS
jgi:hypothetical protein